MLTLRVPYLVMPDVSYEALLHDLAVEALESGAITPGYLFRIMSRALSTYKWRSGKRPTVTAQPQVVPRTGT